MILSAGTELVEKSLRSGGLQASQTECTLALSKTVKRGWVPQPMGEAHEQVDDPGARIEVLRDLGKSQALVTPCLRPPTVQLTEPPPIS